jgi:hypothetical protein
MNWQESVELFERLTPSEYFRYVSFTSGESLRHKDYLTEKEGAVEAIIGGIVGLIVGAAATNVVTSIASGTGSVLRGVAKEVIKGGMIIQESVSDMFSGGGSYFSDIVTEAKAELASTPAGTTLPAKAHSHK